MDKPIEQLLQIIKEKLPQCSVSVDGPDASGGSWMLDVKMGMKCQTLEYRPGKGFGLFRDETGYGEGPSEVYRTPTRTVQRLAQLMQANKSEGIQVKFKDLRELYGLSQVQLAKKVGIKQSAISRFENRDEFKLSTLAAAVKALGGKLEVRAHFADSEITISLESSKG